jgi:hypothetical protein
VLEELQQCDRADRELLLHLLRSAARNADGNPPEEAAARLAQLQALAAALQARAPLALGTVCFCGEITGFGGYRRLRPDPQHPDCPAFQAGADDLPGEPMQLYVEVRNFQSQSVNGRFKTRLTTTVKILDSSGNVVMPPASKTRDEYSLSPRQDYYITLGIPVPPQLRESPYPYTLWLEVRDETPPPPGCPPSGRAAHTTLDFRVDRHSARTDGR